MAGLELLLIAATVWLLEGAQTAVLDLVVGHGIIERVPIMQAAVVAAP